MGAVSAAKKVVRRRGRPPILSRDAVLQAALDLSAADPLTPVSVTTVARHLNVTSMAIYKYYASRDELLQALSAKLLEGFSVQVSDAAGPVERIEIWLRGLRGHFLKNKQLINLLTWEDGQISVAWENHTAALFEALEDLGFTQDEFSETALWIFISGMSAIVYEMRARLMEASPVAPNYERLSTKAAGGRATIEKSRKDPEHHERLFDFQVNRLIASLRDLVAARARGI